MGTSEQETLTKAEATTFITEIEGAGIDANDLICATFDDPDSAVITWCKEKLGKELDADDAWEEVSEWLEKEEVPLKGRYLKLCQKHVQESIDDMNGDSMFFDHQAAVARYALVESLDDGVKEILSDSIKYCDSSIICGLPSLTDCQYFIAAEPVLLEEIKKCREEHGIKGIFTYAFDADESRMGNVNKLLKDYVRKYPEHKVALVEALIANKDIDSWFTEEKWYVGLEVAIETKAKQVLESACTAWEMTEDQLVSELPITVKQALIKGGAIEGEAIAKEEIEAQAELVNVVSPTRLTGAVLLERVDAMENAGVSPRDVLIRTGYYTDGCDYGQANIDFFSAKLAATKGAGVAMTSREVEAKEPTEAEIKEEEIENLKNALEGGELGDFDLLSKTRNQLMLDGEVSDRVKVSLEAFCKSINPEQDPEDAVLTKEELESIVLEYATQYAEKEIKNPHFEFLSLYFTLEAESDWDTALEMMDFVKRHPEYPHLRKRFAEFMTNWTEAGIEHSVYLAFRSPVFDLIKDEHEVFSKLSFEYILPIDGNVIDNSLCDGETAEVLDEPQTIENLKQLGYIVKPRTAERIAEVKAHLAEVEAKEKAKREAIQKEYDSMPKAEKDLEDSFYEAIDNCNFDSIFSDSEKYKELIVENVQDIASNFDQYNPYCKNGREPAWLLTALEDAGAVFTENEKVDT